MRLCPRGYLGKSYKDNHVVRWQMCVSSPPKNANEARKEQHINFDLQWCLGALDTSHASQLWSVDPKVQRVGT